MDDDYELVPQKDVLELKKQVEELRKNPLQGIGNANSLITSMDNLSRNISNMLHLFKEASEEMKIEERESQLIAKRIEPMHQKLDQLMEENQAIAKGVLQLIDTINETKAQMDKLMKLAMAPAPIPTAPAPAPEINPQPLPQMAPIPPLPNQENKPVFKW